MGQEASVRIGQLLSVDDELVERAGARVRDLRAEHPLDPGRLHRMLRAGLQ
jgi:hypothetical protein